VKQLWRQTGTEIVDENCCYMDVCMHQSVCARLHTARRGREPPGEEKAPLQITEENQNKSRFASNTSLAARALTSVNNAQPSELARTPALRPLALSPQRPLTSQEYKNHRQDQAAARSCLRLQLRVSALRSSLSSACSLPPSPRPMRWQPPSEQRSVVRFTTLLLRRSSGHLTFDRSFDQSP
jgi:hypothetical protein